MPTLLLKILTGIHLGAEVELSATELTLGRDASCDLILDDQLLAGQHVVLAVRDGQVHLRFLTAGHIGLEAQAAGTETILPPGEIVTVGATQFCIGPLGGAWPDLKLPAWQSLQGTGPDDEPAREQASNPGVAAPPAGRAASVEANGGSDPNPTPDPAQTGDPTAAGATAPKPTQTGRRQGARVVYGALAVIIILIAAFGFSLPWIRQILVNQRGDGDTPLAPGLAAAQRRKALQAVCEAHHLALKEDGDQAMLIGLVERDEDLNVIRKAIQSIAPPPEFKVYSRPQMQMAAEAVIRGFGYPVKVQMKDQGLMALNGTAPSPEDWARVLVRLKEDVPGVRRFEAKIEYVSQIQEAMAADLKGQGLNHIQMKLDQGVLVCTGGVEESLAEKWKSLLADWPKKYMSIARIEDQTLLVAAGKEQPRPEPVTPPIAEATPVLPGTIIAVRTHPVASFATADGATFFTGASLKSGYTVETIKPTGIWVRESTGAGNRHWIALGNNTFGAAPEGKQEARLER